MNRRSWVRIPPGAFFSFIVILLIKRFREVGVHIQWKRPIRESICFFIIYRERVNSLFMEFLVHNRVKGVLPLSSNLLVFYAICTPSSPPFPQRTSYGSWFLSACRTSSSNKTNNKGGSLRSPTWTLPSFLYLYLTSKRQTASSSSVPVNSPSSPRNFPSVCQSPESLCVRLQRWRILFFVCPKAYFFLQSENVLPRRWHFGICDS